MTGIWSGLDANLPAADPRIGRAGLSECRPKEIFEEILEKILEKRKDRSDWRCGLSIYPGVGRDILLVAVST